jgi:hypothetical protein
MREYSDERTAEEKTSSRQKAEANAISDRIKEENLFSTNCLDCWGNCDECPIFP